MWRTLTWQLLSAAQKPGWQQVRGGGLRGGALHCTDQKDGGDRGGKVVVFVKSNVSAEEDTGSTVGAGGGGSGGTLQLKRARHPALAWDQPP